MNRKSLPGPAEPATAPPLEMRRWERWAITWSALRDRARYRAVPIGQATGWTHRKNAEYAGFSLELRKQLEGREDLLEAERSSLQAELDEPLPTPPGSQPRPTGSARQLHHWALDRRAELTAQAAVRAGTAARKTAAARLAAVQTELDQLEGEFETLDGLCESAYLVRVELYNRCRCSRADRKLGEIPPGPPYEGPGWRTRRRHLSSVQTRSA
jgi:hypothetical protein